MTVGTHHLCRLVVAVTAFIYLFLCLNLWHYTGTVSSSTRTNVTGRWGQKFHKHQGTVGDVKQLEPPVTAHRTNGTLEPEVKAELVCSSNGSLQQVEPNVSQSVIWERQQMSRKQLLRDRCVAFKAKADTFDPPLRYEANSWRRFPREFIVIEPLKVVYCTIPKVSSTTILRMLLNVTGHLNPNKHNVQPHQLGLRKFTSLDYYDLGEAQQILATYKKFLFVRNPLERFLSAYRNKIETNVDPAFKTLRNFIGSVNGHTKLVPKIAKTKLRLRTSGTVVQKSHVTLSQFSSFVLAEKKSTLKRARLSLYKHWCPMYEICQPCLVDYDWIGHFDSLQTDICSILMALVGENRTFYVPRHDPKHVTNSADENTQRQLFATLSSSNIKALIKYYEIDSDLFGFDIPKIIGKFINN